MIMLVLDVVYDFENIVHKYSFIDRTFRCANWHRSIAFPIKFNPNLTQFLTAQDCFQQAHTVNSALKVLTL